MTDNCMFRNPIIIILIFNCLKIFSQGENKETIFKTDSFSTDQNSNEFTLPRSKHKHIDSLQGLQNDIYLHPLNSNTAYTLKKREVVYNQAPASFPIPSWGWIGITDWLTAEVDFLPLIGGLFVKPNLPVPSFNFRFKLLNQNKLIPALAYETMFQYLYKEFDQSTNPYFATFRQSGSWYNHLNASWKIKSKFYIHFSAGCTFAQHLRLVNKDTLNPIEKIFTNKVTPDISLGLDYRLRRISFHINSSYGSTFNYIDNVPRKFEIMYGVRLAPFYKNRYGFLRTFRVEWAGFYDVFPDIKAKAYVPIFIPYLYWQWVI